MIKLASYRDKYLANLAKKQEEAKKTSKVKPIKKDIPKETPKKETKLE